MIRSYKIILLLFFTITINTQVHASQTSYEPAYLGKKDAVKLKDATNSKNTKSQQISEKDFSEKLIDDADKVKNTENTDIADTESLTIEEKNYPDPYE
nr:hypothetical protein [Gammaproteobacteria bacterium]